MNFSPLRPRQTVVLAKLEPDERRGLLTLMTPEDLLRYDADFESWLHEGQRPPSEEGWRTWLMMAGRGYAKRGPAPSGSPASPRRAGGRCGSPWSARPRRMSAR